MTLKGAIEIVEKWQAGGFATRIEDMNPALSLLIEAAKHVKAARVSQTCLCNSYPLLGETKG